MMHGHGRAHGRFEVVLGGKMGGGGPAGRGAGPARRGTEAAWLLRLLRHVHRDHGDVVWHLGVNRWCCNV